MNRDTICVQGGYTPGNGEPRQIPIIQSTTFKYATSEDMGKLFDLEASGYFYTRLQNPTNDHVAAKIAALEGGTAAMLTQSVLAGPCARYLLHDVRAETALLILAPSLPFMAVSGAVRGCFLAARRVQPNITAQLIEQLVRMAVAAAGLRALAQWGAGYGCAAVLLGNTVSANGSVSRGVCVTDESRNLVSVTERTCIEPYADGIHYSEDGGKSWADLPADCVVSMNLWGFTPAYVQEAKAGFAAFLQASLPVNPMKCEYYLPTVVTNALEAGKADVHVLTSADKWHGITYREDKPELVEALKKMSEDGLYPVDRLF